MAAKQAADATAAPAIAGVDVTNITRDNHQQAAAITENQQPRPQL